LPKHSPKSSNEFAGPLDKIASTTQYKKYLAIFGIVKFIVSAGIVLLYSIYMISID
jgi:hypothetical protein